MKTNKITLMIMGLALASLFASCKKENDNNGAVVGAGFKATTELRDGSNRTIGVPNAAGTGIEVHWTSGDQILVANQSGAGSTLTYNLSGGAGSTEGTFKSHDENDAFLQPDYVAIYPATNAAGTANSIGIVEGDIKATFNLTATQNYQNNSFGDKAMPMVAYSTIQELSFKNVLGGICFPMVGNGVTVTKIVLTSAADEPLWGTCTTTISATGDPTSTVSNTDANKKAITLDCGSGIVLDPTTATDFYIMVPAGTLETGFTVEAFYGDNKIFEKSTTSAPGANFIPRSVVRKMQGDPLQVGENVTTLNVTTMSPTFITMNSAKVDGSVVIDAGVTLDDCGICYLPVSPQNYDAMPDLNGDAASVTASTTGASFSVNLTGLQKDQMYAVRAWVRDNAGVVSYGDAILFATRKDYANDYGGRIPFPFSVGPNTKVNFSMGNLQYLGTGDNGTLTPLWRFADYQYEFMGKGGEDPTTPYFTNYSPTKYNTSTSDITEEMKSARDLFGWGTSGWNSGAVAYQPYSYSPSNDGDYYPGGDYNNDLVGAYAQADWGVYNAIDNGGQQAGMWRVLTGGEDGEWQYLVNGRTSQTYRFSQLAIYPLRGGVVPCYGVVLFPDGFVWPSYIRQIDVLNNLGSLSIDLGPLIQGNLDFSSWESLMITEAEWSLLEQMGAVFLPAAGYRSYSDGIGNVIFSGFEGIYTSSTHIDAENTFAFDINLALGMNPVETQHRRLGSSVRLVCPANQNSGNFNNQPFGVNP